MRRPQNGSFLPVEQMILMLRIWKVLNWQCDTPKSVHRGHGCAGDWLQNGPDDTSVTRVFSDCFPSFEVRNCSSLYGENGYKTEFCEFAKLDVDINTSRPAIIANLNLLAEDYRRWIDKQAAGIGRFDNHLSKAANEIISECKQALKRIEGGIEFLQR